MNSGERVVVRVEVLRVTRPARTAERVRSAATDADGEAHAERQQRAPRQVRAALTSATHNAGQRAELRAHDHRAHDQDRLVEHDAHGRDLHRQDHEGDEADATAPSSRTVRCSTSSQTTASDGRPVAAFSAASAQLRDGAVDRVSTAIEPCFGISSSLRSLMIDAHVLARHVAEDHVAVGLVGDALQVDHVQHRAASRTAAPAPARASREERRSGGGASGRPPAPPWRSRARAHDVRDRRLRSVSGPRTRGAARPRPAAPRRHPLDRERGGHGRVAMPATVRDQVELVVEARRRPVAHPRLRHDHVAPPVASSRRTARSPPARARSSRCRSTRGSWRRTRRPGGRTPTSARGSGVGTARRMRRRLSARKVAASGPSVRDPPYLCERMFPRLTERIGTALDLVVEFSTLGEYCLGALRRGPRAPRPPS